MLSYDYPKIRLCVEHPLSPGGKLTIVAQQAHYLLYVMRMKIGGEVALFNGQDGEWRARIEQIGRKELVLLLVERLREQAASPDVWLLFAPIKHSDVVVEKATELGAVQLQPVMTQHTVIPRVNEDKLHARIMEAAEQCERLDVPELNAPVDFATLLRDWPEDRAIIYGDESGGGAEPASLFASLPQTKFAVLVGPEGGFSEREREKLKAHPNAYAMTLGPRILRADTAAVAMLTLVQAAFGDWQHKPAFRSAS